MKTTKRNRRAVKPSFNELDLRQLDIDLTTILNSHNPTYFLMQKTQLEPKTVKAIGNIMLSSIPSTKYQSFLDILDFSDSHLNQANFSDLDLTETIRFKGANFKKANLKRTNFSYANFSHLSEKEVNTFIKRHESIYFKIIKSSFIPFVYGINHLIHYQNNIGLYTPEQLCANFNQANLSQTNFSGAFLYGANLQNSKIFDTNFSHAHLNWANLSHLNLENIDFRGADLRWSCLTNANLSNADLRNTDLRYANLKGATIEHALINQHTMINLTQRHHFKSSIILQ